MSRPRGHKPANLGRPNWFNRRPATAPVPLVKELFRLIDATELSLSAFGELCGYSIVSLSQWRHGRSRPTISAITDIAEAAGYRLELVPIGTENKIDSSL